MPVTYPNQRLIKINRERVSSDFLGIKNENWQSAARDLGAHALLLYMYLASNANNFQLALSPAAVSEAIGMPRSTYHDQFHKLVNRGYLVASHGNTFDFYELPQPSAKRNNVTNDGLNFDDDTPTVSSLTRCEQPISSEDIEINKIDIKNKDNKYQQPISQADKDKLIPKVREITISSPIPNGKNRPKPIAKPKRTVFDS